MTTRHPTNIAGSIAFWSALILAISIADLGKTSFAAAEPSESPSGISRTSKASSDSCIFRLTSLQSPPLAFSDSQEVSAFVNHGPNAPVLADRNPPLAFSGETIEWLKATRDVVRHNVRVVSDRVKEVDGIFKMYMISRITNSNALFSGKSGTGKTLLANLITQMEADPVFKLALHFGTPETWLTGGIDMEAYQKGLVKINSEGNISNAKLFVLDEIDKAIPALMGPLLGLLEMKRIIWYGLDKVERTTITEAGLLLSNATAGEFLDQYRKANQTKLAEAVLSRLHFKAVFPTKLPLDKLRELSIRDEILGRSLALDHWYPEITTQNGVEDNPLPVDWEGLNRFSRMMFHMSDTTKSGANNIFHDFRSHIVGQMDLENGKGNARPFPFVPDFEPSPRGPSPWQATIAASALIDFLLSPLADDQNLKGLKPMELSPLSLWRLHPLMATTAPGAPAQLQITRDPEIRIGVHYPYGFPEGDALDESMKKYFEDQLTQRNDANRALNDEIKKIADALHKFQTIMALIADNPESPSDGLNPTDFEGLIMAFQRRTSAP